MMYKGALLALAAVALVALLTGRNIVRRRVVTLNGLRYELTLFSNETLEIARQDGLKFAFDRKTGAQKLEVGTTQQMQDALVELKRMAASELYGERAA